MLELQKGLLVPKRVDDLKRRLLPESSAETARLGGACRWEGNGETICWKVFFSASIDLYEIPS